MLHVCLPIYLSIYPSTYQSINLSFSYHLHFSGTRFSSPVQQWQSWNECRCLGWKLLVLVNKGWEMDDHPKKDLIFCLNMFNLDIFKRYMVLLMLCLNMFNLKTIYIYIYVMCAFKTFQLHTLHVFHLWRFPTRAEGVMIQSRGRWSWSCTCGYQLPRAPRREVDWGLGKGSKIIVNRG